MAMSDKETVDYARKIILANLNQYIDMNPSLVNDIAGISFSDELLRLHIKGTIAVLKKADDILGGKI